ncbi:Tetratricopeptide repeat (TPR) superfamily protein [Salix suchowensis]|nr:Tetratricopeptide repeat (TPR) superfamily protein [Salix suchowensis]
MLPSSLKLSRAATATVARTVQLGLASFKPSLSSPYRMIHDGVINGPNANPVALQMIDYALSLAKSKKSDESHAQAMLVLEQCLSSQSSESQDVVTHNSKGMVLLAMSSLLSARGNYDDAMEKLQNIQDLVHLIWMLEVVAAMEALTGINLEMGNDDTSSVLADKCLELLGKVDLKNSDEGSEVAIARAKAIKGLTELVQGNLESAEPLFQGFLDNKGCIGNAALTYGEFLHATRNFSLAKDIYQKVIQEVAKKKDFTDVHALAACNMASEEVLLAATCSLGQLEVHMGNFGNAEETLTTALNRAEQLFGSHHPKVGVILTCLALMFQHKAKQEHSSSLLIQEVRTLP